ncbi:MAG: hypothetical protein J3Q66DRAFT_353180 [Benniella sp.]|nr:MAG: hypothetical protein J3Q66DRAFT_353180 [Benniella sp.]
MSLFRYTASRTLIANTRAIPRLPLVAVRPFFSPAPQVEEERDLLKHAPGWKHENASQSEANVKADREPSPPNVKHMQNESVEHLKGKADDMSKSATSTMQDLKGKAQEMSENMSGQSQEYARKAMEVGENMVENVSETTRGAGEYASKQGREMSEKAKTEASKAKKGAEAAGENVMGSVKAGAEKVTQFVKESVDSAKKAVGMNK